MKRVLACAIALWFAGPAAAGAQAVPSAPAPVYSINAHDQLAVQVVGQPEFSQKVVVRSDGYIDLPLVGEIRVAGRSPAAAADAIAAKLQTYIKQPQVTVSLVDSGNISVTVLGDVKNPGTYGLHAGAHVADAVAAAGGLDAVNGQLPNARVAFGDGSLRQVALDPLLRKADLSVDPALTDRSAIYVPGPTTFEIHVLGAVDHPGTIVLNEGDRLSMAIAKAGDTVNATGDFNHIMVTRTEPDGTTASHPVDLYQAIVKGDIRYDPLLRKGDLVYVPIGRQTHGALSTGLFLLTRLLIL
jgi:polysaccharide biosynthesis/export protein